MELSLVLVLVALLLPTRNREITRKREGGAGWRLRKDFVERVEKSFVGVKVGNGKESGKKVLG